MTAKEATEKDREQWKAVSKRLEYMHGISASSKNMTALRDGVNALSEEIRKYVPTLKERVSVELP